MAAMQIAFLAITHQPNQRNFVWGSRMACRQGLHDKNCKFLKSKMADCRHFENRKIATSQLKIVWFRWNSAHYSNWWTRLQSRDQKLKLLIFKMAVAPSWKSLFLAITHQPIVRFQRHFVWGSRTACQQGLHDKNCKFFKSKMADGGHFVNRKIAISQWKIVWFWWNLVHYIRYWTRLVMYFL